MCDCILSFFVDFHDIDSFRRQLVYVCAFHHVHSVIVKFSVHLHVMISNTKAESSETTESAHGC